jgi:hypothetical protein
VNQSAEGRPLLQVRDEDVEALAELIAELLVAALEPESRPLAIVKVEAR